MKRNICLTLNLETAESLVQDTTLPQALVMRSADISAHIRDTDQSYMCCPSILSVCTVSKSHDACYMLHATAFLMQDNEPCHLSHRPLHLANAARPKSGERSTCQSRFDRPNFVHLPHESRLVRVEHMAVAADCLYDSQLEHDLDRVQRSTFQTVGLCG